MKIISIHQPGYLPWLGFFKKIMYSDVFVFLDNVKFEKRSWQMRNKLKIILNDQEKEAWIKIPTMLDKSDTEIRNVLIDNSQNWKITLVNTGDETLTSLRISKIKKYLNDERFFLTYGDGLANINIDTLLENHIANNKICTVTAVKPSGRFGVIKFSKKISFSEKNSQDVDWINGGFFVCEPEVFKYIDDNEDVMWEKKPMENIAKSNQLNAYKHDGFWSPMDTLKDQNDLNELWNSNNAKWKTW